MKSLNELKSLRERLEKSPPLTESAAKKVTVGMGTCGIAAGARAVLLTFLDELASRSLPDTVVTQTACLGMCEKEPLVEVSVDGKSTLYANVNAERARRIVVQHLINGDVIIEWAIERA